MIPTFNGGAFIGEALQSVVGQSQAPTEIIVVDDGSTDGTCDIVRTFQRRSIVQIKLIERSTNSGGPGVPICMGVENARGELVAVLDQDDVYLPQTLEKHQEALSSTPRASISFTMSARMDQPGRPAVSEKVVQQLEFASMRYDRMEVIPRETMIRLLLTHGNFVRGFPGFVLRRSCWDGIATHAKKWRVVFDMVVLRELLLRGDACFLPIIGYLRRVHDGNVSGQVIPTTDELLRFAEETLRDVDPSLRDDAGVRCQQKRWVHRLANASARSEAALPALLRHVRLLSMYGMDPVVVWSIARLPANRARAALIRLRRRYQPMARVPVPKVSDRLESRCNQ